jgi:hypothetical protein
VSHEDERAYFAAIETMFLPRPCCGPLFNHLIGLNHPKRVWTAYRADTEPRAERDGRLLTAQLLAILAEGAVIDGKPVIEAITDDRSAGTERPRERPQR